MITHIKFTVEQDVVVYLPINAIGISLLPNNKVHVFSMYHEDICWTPKETIEYFEKEIINNLNKKLD